MDAHSDRYLDAVRLKLAQLRGHAKAQDEYDRIWWEIELKTRSTLTASALHKRVMRRLKKRT